MKVFKRFGVTIAVVAAIDGFLAIVSSPHIGFLRFQNKVEPLAFLTIAGFIVTISELSHGRSVERAKFVSEYVARIYTDRELSSSFHDLIETFSNATFQKIDAKIGGTARALRKASNGPIFDGLEDFNIGRVEGSRYYHPECFQGSEEERRLDALLGYLDVIGYYYMRHLITIAEVGSILNNQLALLSSREVIQRYLKVSGETWYLTTTIHRDSGGRLPPFAYLRALLGDFIEYNTKMKRFWEAEEQRVQGKAKNRFM